MASGAVALVYTSLVRVVVLAIHATRPGGLRPPGLLLSVPVAAVAGLAGAAPARLLDRLAAIEGPPDGLSRITQAQEC